MHGLIFKSLQCFVTDTYGTDKWLQATRLAELDLTEFEPMLTYDPAMADRILTGVGRVLDRAPADVMEDLGTYLVSNPATEGLRRLLRFGGVNFVEFLHSLYDLSDRARLAVPDLILPKIDVQELSGGDFRLTCTDEILHFGHVLIGLLRTMADDYGVLALLAYDGKTAGGECVSVTLVEAEFAEGRAFELGTRA